MLPEVQHRPSTATGQPADDQPEASEQAAAPADEERWDDIGNDYATEPEESGNSDVIIVNGAARDPAVWYRANSPRNRPGQPIRQPNRPAHRGR